MRLFIFLALALSLAAPTAQAVERGTLRCIRSLLPREFGDPVIAEASVHLAASTSGFVALAGRAETLARVPLLA